MNQPVPTKPGEAAAAAVPPAPRVHCDVRIGGGRPQHRARTGRRWFSSNAVDTGRDGPDGLEYLQCAIGEGAAATLGEDAGKKRLAVGDTFELGDRWWKVDRRHEHARHHLRLGDLDRRSRTRSSGRAARGTSSRRWCCGWPTTRTAGARRWPTTSTNATRQAKLKAFAEPDYYKELTKTNEQFLTAIVMMAIIMAVGGRVRRDEHDVRVDRGADQGSRGAAHPRLQAVADPDLVHARVAGHRVSSAGSSGCLLGYLANGFEAASTLSGGQGGGKSVTLTMIVDTQIIAAGTAVHAGDGPARRAGPGALGDADGDPRIAAITAARA